MAEKRMFSKTIVRSARFLQMPQTAQNLYFQLCLDADDDGIVEAYTTMKLVGSREDDLKILVAKKFVKILNEDLVSYIMDWHVHNSLRSDRKKDSIYQDLLLEMLPDVPIVKKKPRSDLKNTPLESGQSMDSPRTGNGRTMDGIDKYSIVENSIEEYSNSSAPAREEDEEAQISLILDDGSWYIISTEEISFYQKSFPDIDVVSAFKGLSSWCFSNAEKRKNKRSVKGLMDRWLRNEQEKINEQAFRKNSQSAAVKPVNNKFNNFPQRVYDMSDLEKKLLNSSKEIDNDG